MLRHKIHFIKIVPLLVFLAAGCATVPKEKISKIYLKDLCDRHNIQWLWDSVSLVITLRYEDAEATALTGSDIVVLGTEKILLSAPVVRERHAIVVPADFEEKIICRLVEKHPVFLPPGRPYKIVIDAGHGGKDPGTTGGSGLQEKEVVIDISRRLKERLEQKGLKVEMTRQDDKFISLEKRTEITSRAKADLFVSIHANSSPSKGVHGVEVFSYRELGEKEKQEDQRQKNQRILFDNLSMKKNDPALESTLADMLDQYKWSMSWLAAAYVAKGVSRGANAKNRGTKKSGFFVLRNTLIPAVLVEVGFLSNRQEEELLKTSSHRQRIANALAESIMEYVNR